MFGKKCPKCESESLTKEYHKGIDEQEHGFAKSCGNKAVNTSDKEHLHYYCDSCGYDWIENTADHKGK